MFLHLSVCLSPHGRGCYDVTSCYGHHHPPTASPPPPNSTTSQISPPPDSTTPPSTSVGYASYWNAFLFSWLASQKSDRWSWIAGDSTLVDRTIGFSVSIKITIGIGETQITSSDIVSYDATIFIRVVPITFKRPRSWHIVWYMHKHCNVHKLLVFSQSRIIVPLFHERNNQQECIPVGCVPPARYRMGGSPCQRPPWTETPWTEIPQTETSWTETPWTETPQTETSWDGDPWTGTPWTETPDRDLWDRDPPGQRPPDRELLRWRPPWTETPLGWRPPWADTETPLLYTDKHLWKHNLRKLCLQVVTRKHSSRTHTARFSDWAGQTPPRQRPSWQRPPWKEHGTRDRDRLRRNIGPGSQTGSDIIQRPTPPSPVDRQTLLKILPCPQLLLRAVINISSCA